MDVWLPVRRSLQLVPYDSRSLDFWKRAEFWTEEQNRVLDAELSQFGEWLSLKEVSDDELTAFPVVIFSHGFGAWSTFYTYIIAEIVSHGIGVIGINHTYNAGIAQFQDQTIYGKILIP